MKFLEGCSSTQVCDKIVIENIWKYFSYQVFADTKDDCCEIWVIVAKVKSLLEGSWRFAMGHLDTEDQTALLTLTYCPARNIEIGSTQSFRGTWNTDNLEWNNVNIKLFGP